MRDGESRFDFAAEIEAAFRECRVPRWEFGKVADWCGAIQLLLQYGKLGAGEYGIHGMGERFRGVSFVERMSAVFARLPPPGTQLPFDDDLAKDVQVVARPGAEIVVLLFCGASQELGLPVAMEHRWHGHLNASLIYLRDFQCCSYLRGVPSLGENREATLSELRRIVASIGGQRIVCYGTSAGVFGALDYGLELEAEAVLGMSGASNLAAKFTAYSPWEEYGMKLGAEIPNAALDMRPLYARANRAPRVRLVYGRDHWDDRIQAEHMGGLACVTLQPVDGFGEHNSIVEVIIRGEFERLLRWLVSPAAPIRGAVTKTSPAVWSNTLRRLGLRLSRKAVRRARSSQQLRRIYRRVRSILK
jgi:hypothetical protein